MASYPYTPIPDKGAKVSVLTYLVTTMYLVVLMMIYGLLMRLEHAQYFSMGEMWFYKIMTLHGVGVVGMAGIAGAAIMWHFLREYVDLSEGIFVLNYALFISGVILILGSIFLGNFAGAWTFLYPLPSHAMGTWFGGASPLFLGGLLLISIGFLLQYLDTARAIIKRYGSLARALGWPQLFGPDDGKAPPPTVVASTMVTIINLTALLMGNSILVMMLVNFYVPSFDIDPLLAKGMIYMFGHTFINSTIYMAVIAVYEILPRYTQRPWKSNKVFLASWTAATIMVMSVFPHHLLMDFAYPKWLLVVGQVLSYTSTLPIIVVTGFGGMMIVYRSGIRWDMCTRFLFLSLCGWSIGVIPAFIDATISINYVMHNTLWVPGHFHMYLMLGFVSMIFGFMYYLGKPRQDAQDSFIDVAAFWGYATGTIGLSLCFLYGGKESVPRRWAAHIVPEWLPPDRIASAFTVVIIACVLVFFTRFIIRMGSASRDHTRASIAVAA